MKNREPLNLDYGRYKADTKEGAMVKRAVLVMLKDLHSLYVHLNDDDDLPTWCHYKIARAKGIVGDVSDYLTAKITKIVAEKDMNNQELRCEIKKVLEKKVK